VLELNDLEDRALDVYVVAVLELVGVDDVRSAPSRAKFDVVRSRAHSIRPGHDSDY
jgi:hypothetical protein